MTAAVHFLSGLLTMGYVVVALFFLRFWRESRDRLFAYFSLCFAVLALQRVLLGIAQPAEILYAIRLLAFVLLAVGIVEKNRSAA